MLHNVLLFSIRLDRLNGKSITQFIAEINLCKKKMNTFTDRPNEQMNERTNNRPDRPTDRRLALVYVHFTFFYNQPSDVSITKKKTNQTIREVKKI